ncbi:hypothetical protein RhiirA1_480901, partial [Rhizophagus irregularis]
MPRDTDNQHVEATPHFDGKEESIINDPTATAGDKLSVFTKANQNEEFGMEKNPFHFTPKKDPMMERFENRKAIAQLFYVHSHNLEYKGANIMNDRIKSLVGQPIGVAFKNGLSISGVLCDVTDEEIILMEYKGECFMDLDAVVVLMDNLWVALGAILVFFMLGGFILLEAGSTRMKNAGHIAGKTIFTAGIGTLVFWAVGYGFIYGEGNPFIGLSSFFYGDFSAADGGLTPA